MDPNEGSRIWSSFTQDINAAPICIGYISAIGHWSTASQQHIRILGLVLRESKTTFRGLKQ